MAHQTVREWDVELVPTIAGRSDVPDEACPVEAALNVITGRWSTLIIRELLQRAMSYSDLRRTLPALSDKVLSDRLASLHELGVVQREVDRGYPNRVTYRLTPRGEELRPLMIELYRVGEALLRPA